MRMLGGQASDPRPSTRGRKPRRWRTRGIALLAVGILAALAGVFWYERARSGTPSVELVFPADGAADVFAGTQIQVGFDRPLGAAAERLQMRLTDADGARVNGSVRFNDNLTVVTFTPAAALSSGPFDVRVQLGAREKVWRFTVPAKPPISTGVGGPILVINNGANPFEPFYAEILRAEGLTSFATAGSETLSARKLSAHRIAIVTGTVADSGQVAVIRKWLEDGGKLIVMRPTGELAALAGLEPPSSILNEGYLRIDTSNAPGRGLVGETIQFHGEAAITTVTPGTRTIATLYRDAATSADAPAVTIRRVGDAGGEIAAFTFDLAKSVVLTRQGNPDWSGQERDGSDPVRPNDLFFGASRVDPKPDFIDLDKVAIPQADEQMRLLSNLIAHLARDGAPLPRFWYFPRDAKAVLVMAADDHGTASGTQRSFDRMLALSPEGCDVAKWECPRATSWMYVTSGLSDSQAAAYIKQGFDIGSHVSTYCHNWSEYSLDITFADDLRSFRRSYPSLPPQQGSRLHCIAWSDYVSQPRIERAWGIRFDMNYYYWPPTWVRGRAGFMTGSGLPMRFSDANGGLIDVYQQETHLVDEVFASLIKAVAGLFDRALGPEGYYGAFGTHYDFNHEFDAPLMKMALKRGIPMVSAQQMLDWTDGRQASTFKTTAWADGVLTFDVKADGRVEKLLRGMLPMQAAGGRLREIRVRDKQAVAFATETIKGIEYALFDARSGSYLAIYDGQAHGNAR